jgi:hypothetical protein
LNLLDHPLVMFLLSLVLLWVSLRLGVFIAQRSNRKREDKADLELVTSASLTLLGLIIGFSFSMAVSRYDQRKNYEEEEANAIGTEYARVGLLSTGDATLTRSLLTQYLQKRLLFYSLRDSRQLQEVDRQTTTLQNDLWSKVERAAGAQPTPPMALVLSGMNDVLNRQGYTQAAWWNRLPTGAWCLMAALAVCCSFLIGYRAEHKGGLLFAALPFVISVAFFLIADIDSPRWGVIRISPQNLISLDASLRGH